MDILNVYQKSKVKIRVAMCMIFLQLNKLLVFADTKGKSTESVEAENIGDTKLVTGTVKLFNDAHAALLIILPILATCLLVYFFARKNGADESDQKQWDKRIKITFICTIGAVVASGLVKTVIGYYM